MSDTPFEYEGRIEFRDVEPGLSGDVIKLLDHSSEYATLDWALQQEWFKRFLSCAGPVPGVFKITVERIK